MGEDAILPIAGIRLAATAAGIRYQGRDDLVLMELAPSSRCAAVLTRNAFCAAPVVLVRQHLGQSMPRYLLINAGNANAGTGAPGLAAARACCQAVAEAAGCSFEEVLPFSTGVIGEPLPVERIVAAIPALLSSLQPNGWMEAARAIMTTDTRPKLVSRTFAIGGRRAAITGIAKGAGMICPNMATMLAFIATDAQVAPECLRACLHSAVDRSFNAITIDGDTSTNDACVLIATGTLGNPPLADLNDPGARAFQEALDAVCRELAAEIVRDGEGATKLVRVRVEAARNRDEARQVAYTIAHSPLVKTALSASDPNWGRILAAVGRAGILDLAIEGVELWLGGIQVVAGGARAPTYTEADGAAAMAKPELLIRVALGRGDACAEILTCDLSEDYVRINANYRS
ncbi:bifunctional glutamate N-acetyltransferase/amino-acid acetyltransferase ArgJ [Caldichromatium japonicum]|uniref:Arginine biosynthesis bifunctional protein ArgJ n=1 Tax=Caldichromatium japonicum TaxID=2699430 RepID=A0A6G7VE98_9GAMM|nr:bifunctional glutamate N-acetyltransferase/amino-acid acetyltransferase ArgJ [Caldichromatium japonicum]QIK38369.1 bifunctional glutamate N-acetyltransferase/amino-acid acetyltransferase ArgJ [Caldichromatium japonicum]